MADRARHRRQRRALDRIDLLYCAEERRILAEPVEADERPAEARMSAAATHAHAAARSDESGGASDEWPDEGFAATAAPTATPATHARSR